MSDDECIICTYRFDLQSHDPLVLPCGHTFCKNCISGFQRRSLTFRCPTCRASHPSNTDFPVNSHIRQLLSTSASTSERRAVSKPSMDYFKDDSKDDLLHKMKNNYSLCQKYEGYEPQNKGIRMSVLASKLLLQMVECDNKEATAEIVNASVKDVSEKDEPRRPYVSRVGQPKVEQEVPSVSKELSAVGSPSFGLAGAISGFGGGGSGLGGGSCRKEASFSERRHDCAICGLEGHLSRDCTEPRKESSSACYNCGQKGHRSADCTETRKALGPPRSAAVGRGNVATSAAGSVSYGRGSGGSASKGSRYPVNSVRIISYLHSTFFQYHVEFESEIVSKQMSMEIVRKQCHEITGEFVIFDGIILYVPRCITAEENFTGQHPLTGEPVKVKFRLSVSFGHNDPQAIDFYDLLMRDIFVTCGFMQVQRKFFNPKNPREVENFGVEIWPGYETKVRMYEKEMMLCIDSSFNVLRTQSVNAEEYDRVNGNMDLLRVNCDNKYTGQQRVLTRYNNRLYPLSRFAWDMDPLSTFQHVTSGKYMTFKEYYQSQYNVVIKDNIQPLIISESNPKRPGEDPQVTYFIPELCFLTGRTETMKREKAMLNFTQPTLESRRESTIHFLDLVRENNDVIRLFEAWHVHLDDKLVGMKTL